MSDLIEYLKISNLVAPNANNVKTSLDWKERLNALREMYKILTPMILDGKEFDPYFIDWNLMFTPIEDDVWSCLRRSSLTFYPQYPVLHYNIDFADPIKKIGIEADGRQLHDVIKDQKKDCLNKHRLVGRTA